MGFPPGRPYIRPRRPSAVPILISSKKGCLEPFSNAARKRSKNYRKTIKKIYLFNGFSIFSMPHSYSAKKIIQKSVVKNDFRCFGVVYYKTFLNCSFSMKFRPQPPAPLGWSLRSHYLAHYLVRSPTRYPIRCPGLGPWARSRSGSWLEKKRFEQKGFEKKNIENKKGEKTIEKTFFIWFFYGLFSMGWIWSLDLVWILFRFLILLLFIYFLFVSCLVMKVSCAVPRREREREQCSRSFRCPRIQIWIWAPDLESGK